MGRNMTKRKDDNDKKMNGKKKMKMEREGRRV